MSNFVIILLALAAYGFLCLLVSLKRMVFGNPMQKELQKARSDAANRENVLWENFRKRDQTQTKLIDEQNKMISLLQEKLSVVENPELPKCLNGFNLVYEYDLVPI